MKKLIVAMALVQSVFAASVQDTYLAPVEFKKFTVDFHHADCVASIYKSRLDGKMSCHAKVSGDAVKDLYFSGIMMKSGFPRNSRKIVNNEAKYTLHRSDLACTAVVTISPTRGKDLNISFKFTKLTRDDHASTVMCSKRLIERFGYGNKKQMKFEFTAMVPTL